MRYFSHCRWCLWELSLLSAALRAESDPKKADSPSMTFDQPISALTTILKFLFSWIVLLPIGVIVSGKFLAQRFKLADEAPQELRIQLKGVVLVQSTNEEVILGFAAFIITLLLIGVSAGRVAYDYFLTHFGVDPGHFNSLCVLSSFSSVFWSCLVYLVSGARTSPDPGLRTEHTRLIKRLTKKKAAAPGGD
jgi:hypothetical protein